MILEKIKYFFEFGSFYKNCDELPLSIFFKCLETNDTSLLLKSKFSFISKSTLAKTWDNIFYEYLSLAKDTKYKQTISILKEITGLRFKYFFIYEIARNLSCKYNKNVAEFLHRMGYRNYKLTPESYMQDIPRIIKSAKALLLKLDLLKKDYEQMQNEIIARKKANYNEILIDLSKFLGFRLNSKEISVAEFIAISNRYKEYIDQINKKK